MKDVLSQNLMLLPDKSFENLPSSLTENEIIFLGETHNIRALHQAAAKLAVYLATDRPVVYASESVYSAGSFLEAASLGNPKPVVLQGMGNKPIAIPDCIRAFNSNQTEDKKIVMTTIDIEHSIYHTKSDVVLFLQDVANRSTSDVALQEINSEIIPLPAQDTYEKMDSYLRRLQKIFQQHFDTFSSEDQDEILFSMELFRASNYYQYTRVKIDQSPKHDYASLNKFRTKYFIKTIERAYQKAQKRNAILLCRVGSMHASLAQKTEARYFAQSYPLTKGKVAAIRMVPLYYDASEVNNISTDQNDVASVVKTLMKDNDYSYLSLSDLQKRTDRSFNWGKYFSRWAEPGFEAYYGRNAVNDAPKYNGLLFVKVKKQSN
jgi:hypothetical protein